MSLSFNKIFATVLAGTLLALSAAPVYAQEAQACPQMKTGKYKGQCIDTSVKRAIHILEQSADSITITNFRKNGEFYIAKIPLNQVQNLSYVVVDLNSKPVNFLSLINISHTELRFKMNPGAVIELYRLNDTQRVTPVQTETDIMVSLNFTAPAGVPYDPIKGFNEKLYASVLQVFSTQDEVKIRFQNTKANVYEIPLSLSGFDSALVLREALMISHRVQYDLPYDTWTRNCTTIIFDMLDNSLHLKQKPYRFKSWEAFDTGLAPAFRALAKRRLVLEDTKVLLLNAEFGYGLFPSDSNRYFRTWIGKTLKEFYANDSLQP